MYKRVVDKQEEWVNRIYKDITISTYNGKNMPINIKNKISKLCGSEEKIVLNNFENLTPEMFEEYKNKRNEYVDCVKRTKINLI